MGLEMASVSCFLCKQHAQNCSPFRSFTRIFALQTDIAEKKFLFSFLAWHGIFSRKKEDLFRTKRNFCAFIFGVKEIFASKDVMQTTRRLDSKRWEFMMFNFTIICNSSESLFPSRSKLFSSLFCRCQLLEIFQFWKLTISYKLQLHVKWNSSKSQ